MNLGAQIDQILAEADRVDAAWVEAVREAGSADPAPKVWEADDDARRVLAHDAVAVLREVAEVIS